MVRAALVVGEAVALARDGLVALLAPAWPVGAVQAAGTLEGVVALAEGVPGCVVVLDSQLLGAMPLAALGMVRARLPLAGVIVLTGPEERRGEALAAGAEVVLGKAEGSAALLRAVALVRGGATGAEWRSGVPRLTGRQRDVLRLLAEGRSTKDIARSMDLAVSTIKVHLAALYRTVGARNRVEALCRAGLLAG